MKKILFFLIALACSNLSAGEYAVRDEVLDWSVLTAAGAGGYMLNRMDPLTDKPLIGGRSDLPYHEDTVPMAWIWGAYGISYASIALLPNSDGWLNETSYKNAKGLSAALAFNTLFTGLAKVTVGRKRPSYDNYPDKTDARKSFYSGHSSYSFTAATYLSLFIINNTGDGSRMKLVPKIGIPAVLFSAATAVAVSRVHDHKHHVSDVIVGSLSGIIVAALSYRWANGKYSGTGTPLFGASENASGKMNYLLSVGFTF